MAADRQLLDRADALLDGIGEAGARIRERADDIADPARRLRYIVEAVKTVRVEATKSARYRTAPVDVRTFVESPMYLNKAGFLWPRVMDALEDMTSGRYVESVLTGGIGVAKTTLALYSQAYELYKIMLLRDPHVEFGLDPSSEIVIVFQSVTGATARSVDYARFRDMLQASPWFVRHAPMQDDIKSEILLPRRVKVQPVSSNEHGAIGQNVIGGIIDEINFMAVIEKSKRSIDGGTFDQAVQNYNSIARRRESRFMERGGGLPGMLSLVSSSRYPGQFTDKKKEEAQLPGARIFVYDKRRWEVHPEGYEDGRFRVYVGSLTRRPRILGSDDQPLDHERGHVMEVPEVYRHQFTVDIYNALRDIAGVATQAANPYIPAPDLVGMAFSHGQSVFSAETTDFVTEQLKVIVSRAGDLSAPRWAHVDLGATGDAAGVAIGHVREFIAVERDDGQTETLPVVVLDGVLRVVPPPGGEVMFSKVRSALMLARQMGLPIKWVSFDSWQSRDSLQILRSKGFRVAEVSMDRDNRAYDITKAAIYDRRLLAPYHETCVKEFVRLTYDPKTNKVDHPPDGSKDCADAVAGVTFGLFTRREIWAAHGVRPVVVLPNVRGGDPDARENAS